jgi:DMSO/TMAO reductase YedYZ molybdopterin-dependent catalytic subunit
VSFVPSASPLNRRAFLGALSGLVAAADLLAQEPRPKPDLIVRSARPQDLETPPHLLTSWITPVPLFYVRSHFYTPTVDAARWALRVDGEVAQPLSLALDAVRAMPSRTVVATLECAGNGRALFDPPVAGVQWERGAVGNARWTGVRLADVLARAGVSPAARFVWMDGADVGIGKAPDFVRQLPMDKALDGDTLLAYEMNGQPLPVEHGFPLRVLVPGWEGAYSVKWLTSLRVSDREHPGAFVQSGYRYPRRPVAPGATVNVADTEPLTGLTVKSLITSHRNGATVPAGAAVRIAGFAWAGDAEVRRVDVSTDAGATWAEARLGPDRARYAWRAFEYTWSSPAAGSRAVLSRATDTRGLVQPIVAGWNPAGYLWNVVDQVRLDVAPR